MFFKTQKDGFLKSMKYKKKIIIVWPRLFIYCSESDIIYIYIH